MNRKRYFGYCLVLSTTAIVALAMEVTTAKATMAMIYLAMIPAIYYRLKNTGVSGWWALGTFVPGVSVLINLRAGLVPPGGGRDRWFWVVLPFMVAAPILLVAVGGWKEAVSYMGVWYIP